MKILHVLQFLGIGGLERIVLSLALTQQELGHQVTLYIYDYEQTWVPYFRAQGLDVIVAATPKRPGYDIQLWSKLSSVASGYDIVHTHDLNPLMYYGPIRLGYTLLKKSSPRLIHTTHGLDHITNNPKSLHYEKIFARLADKIISVSPKVAQFYTQQIGLRPSRVLQIDNGVSTYQGPITVEMRRSAKKAVCEKHGLNVELPLLTSLARVVALKDQAFLMKNMIEKPSIQLLIVGPIDPEYHEQLKPLLREHIVLAGPQSEVQLYNMASDLYLSASTHEGIPVAVLEAMALETPCLVSDISGHLVLNTHAHAVETFKINDSDDFTSKLESILSRDLSKLTAQARNIVESHYSLKTMAQKYQQAYQEALC